MRVSESKKRFVRGSHNVPTPFTLQRHGGRPPNHLHPRLLPLAGDVALPRVGGPLPPRVGVTQPLLGRVGRPVLDGRGRLRLATNVLELPIGRCPITPANGASVSSLCASLLGVSILCLLCSLVGQCAIVPNFNRVPNLPQRRAVVWEPLRVGTALTTRVLCHSYMNGTATLAWSRQIVRLIGLPGHPKKE